MLTRILSSVVVALGIGIASPTAAQSEVDSPHALQLPATEASTLAANAATCPQSTLARLQAIVEGLTKLPATVIARLRGGDLAEGSERQALAEVSAQPASCSTPAAIPARRGR